VALLFASSYRKNGIEKWAASAAQPGGDPRGGAVQVRQRSTQRRGRDGHP